MSESLAVTFKVAVDGEALVVCLQLPKLVQERDVLLRVLKPAQEAVGKSLSLLVSLVSISCQ